MYRKIISEVCQRLLLYLHFEYIFFITIEFRQRPSLTINYFCLSYIWDVVMVDAYSVDTHEIRLVFYSTCRKQGIPYIRFLHRPISDQYGEVTYQNSGALRGIKLTIATFIALQQNVPR